MVENLRGVTFEFLDTKLLSAGLIAQDVQQTSFADSVTLDSQGYCVLDTSQMMYALINAVKELSAEVDALKAKVG